MLKHWYHASKAFHPGLEGSTVVQWNFDWSLILCDLKHKQTRISDGTPAYPARSLGVVGVVCRSENVQRFFFQKRNTTREIWFHQCFWLYGKFSLILKGFAWIFIKRGLVQAACSHQKTVRWKMLEASSRVIGRSPKGCMTGYDFVFWLPVGRYLDAQTHIEIYCYSLWKNHSQPTTVQSSMCQPKWVCKPPTALRLAMMCSNWGVTWPLPVPFTWTMEVGEAQ